MPVSKTQTHSEFAQSALNLDLEFTQFARIAEELERVSILSEKGLDKARAFLTELDACGKRIGSGMQALANALDKAREQTEKVASAVSNRAVEVNQRQEESQHMFERLRVLGDMARTITGAVVNLKKTSDENISDEDRALISAQLPEVNAQLNVFVEEARKLTEDAKLKHMVELERSAQSLRQSIQAASNRLNLFVKQNGSEMPLY